MNCVLLVRLVDCLRAKEVLCVLPVIVVKLCIIAHCEFLHGKFTCIKEKCSKVILHGVGVES